MKSVLPLAVLLSFSVSIAACSGGGGAHDAATSSPGVRSTAYLPSTPNNAGTGSHDANTPLAVIGGQVPDSSNPTPAGLPSVSPALN